MSRMQKGLFGLWIGAAGFILASSAMAATQYNRYEDAAVAQAMAWQSGKKAKPIVSSDGKVIFPFGQGMPRLTCSPTRACDVELEPGEKARQIILGDKQNWSCTGAESIEKGVTVAHVVFQPRDNNVESNVIITTDRRTYHIKLYAPKDEGVYLNRVGFYYPEDLVESWESKIGAKEKAQARNEESNLLPAPVSVEMLDYGYTIDGNASFRPIRVVNDGEKVYMEMPDSIRSGPNPSFHLLDSQGKVMVVTYRRKENASTGRVHFEVDRLFDKGQLVMDDEKVTITWKKAKKAGFWNGLFGGGN